MIFFFTQSMEAEQRKKWIPVLALSVSIMSFLFALTVLYPWHITHSRQFSTLARKISGLK
jgi:hypothetical protein